MGMFKRLRRWLSGDPTETRAAQTFSVGQWIGVSPGEIGQGVDAGDPKAYAINAWVYACVNAIAQATASAPLVVEKQRGDEWVPDEKTPLYALLDYVNTQEDQYMLVEQTAAWLALYGNGYWHLLRGSAGARPGAIQVLQANLVEPVPGKGIRNPMIEGYKYTTGSGEAPVFPDIDVVHFKRFNPFSTAVGQAPIRVLELAINTALSVDKYNRAFYKGGGVPSAILTTEQDLSEEQKKRYDAFWDEWVAQGQIRNRPLKLGKGLKLDVPGVSPDTVTVTELPKQLRETICAVLEVPPAIVGIFEYANYANADMQERFFYSRTVAQYWRRIETAINEQLAPQFGTGLRVRFDRNSVAALQPNFAEMATAAATLTGGSPVLTVNEARERLFGLEPLGDAWGETRWGPFSTVPLVTATGDMLSSAPAPTSEPAADAAPKTVTVTARRKEMRRLSAEARTALWKSFNANRDSETKQIKRVVASWYETVTEEMLGNFSSGKGSLGSRVKAPNIDVLVFDRRGGTAALREMIEPVLQSILEAAGQEAIATLGADLRFDVQSPQALALLADRVQEMKTVVATAQDAVRASLAEGIANGETVDQLTDRVMQWSASGKLHHAENVARTESGIVMNTAALQGYKQGGATGKEWLSIVDDRSRQSHADMDGVVVGIDASFDLDGVSCDGPGDPALGPEDVCNCRCTIAPVIEVMR